MNADSNPHSTVKYRCVCGSDVILDLMVGGVCESCNRAISPEMLRSNVSQTIDLGDDSDDGCSSSKRRRHQDANDDRSGTKLGHFQLLNPIGHGGMGRVYRALDESLQRYVALKVLRRGAGNATEMDRLMQEARAQARVNHPHVVHIYYVSPDSSDPFLAMELVNGPTLATRLREGALAFSEVVRIAIETTEALQQSARFDIVHGDIKPGNILLEDAVHVKLSDFGLSQRISQRGEQSKNVSGTPAYMAPEVGDGAEPTIFSDQYSLGVMLFQLTFGRLPYSVGEDSVTAMLNAHKQATVEFPRPWPADLPDEWKHVLARLLAKDPASRFASYSALLEALSNARPLKLPDARWLVRGMAWAVDFTLLLAITAILLIPTQVGPLANLVSGNYLLTGLVRMPILLAPLLAALFQARWTTTPAKKLLQIRIVDQHGLRPGPRTLAYRSVFQFAGVWCICLKEILNAVGFTSTVLGVLTAIAFIGLHVISAVQAIFAKHGRTVHDRIFHTRVCLDVGSTEVR